MRRGVRFRLLVPMLCVLPVLWLWGPDPGGEEAPLLPQERGADPAASNASQQSVTPQRATRAPKRPPIAPESGGIILTPHPDKYNSSWSPLLGLEQRFSGEGKHPTDGSRPFMHVSDALIAAVGEAVVRRRPPFDRRLGQYFAARWASEKTWHIEGYSLRALPDFKRCLDGRWLHISGDSTGEQLFNSLVVTLDPSHRHKLVTRYDDCVPKYHLRRMALLKEHPKNKTAIWENQLWLCHCRQHSLWWEQTFSSDKDGFNFRITYSYKELMFEAADVGLVEGAWPRQRVNGQVVGNLFEAWSGRMPDVWIANSGAHTFHIPNADIDDPPPYAFADHARNISHFAALVQAKYLRPNASRCFLWKANNVPPTHRCPSQFFALNFVTVPAMPQGLFHGQFLGVLKENYVPVVVGMTASNTAPATSKQNRQNSNVTPNAKVHRGPHSIS